MESRSVQMVSYSTLLSKLFSNPMGLFSLPNFQIYQFSFFAALIFVLVAVRIALSAVGRKYSAARLFLGPVFLVILVAYNYYNSYLVSISLNLYSIMKTEVILIPVFVVLGLAAGHKLARKDRVYLKKGTPYYRSSIVISFVWALSFLIKMGIITYLPFLPIGVGLAFSAILDITTGLILGEAIKIHGTYRKEFSRERAAAL